jgi:hypothetical protein
MTERNRDLAKRGTGALPVTFARGGAVAYRVVPVHLACRIGARARVAERDAWPAVVSKLDGPGDAANVEGGLALFVSALQGSLAAGSALGGIVYGQGPGDALIVAGVIAALGALTLLSRAGAAISAGSPSATQTVPPASSGHAAHRPGEARPETSSMEPETAHNKHADVAVRGHTRKDLPCPTRL